LYVGRFLSATGLALFDQGLVGDHRACPFVFFVLQGFLLVSQVRCDSVFPG
jgi:hypothetical protein